MNGLQLLKHHVNILENQTRKMARDKGIRVRKNNWAGIDAYFQDGTKQHYYGWTHAFNELLQYKKNPAD